MEGLESIPVWAVAAGIFALRIVDVSLGTFRTISVVHGRIRLSVVVGFVEVLIWVTAVSQVVTRMAESPILPFAYAAGFAAGNAAGIAIERRIGIGTCVIRMIVNEGPDRVAKALRSMGRVLTTFRGEGHDGPRTLMYTVCPRRDLKKMLGVVQGIDPHVFYVVERFSQTGQLAPLPHPTGWRAVFKKK